MENRTCGEMAKEKKSKLSRFTSFTITIPVG